MGQIKELGYKELKSYISSKDLGFLTTKEISYSDTIIGQSRGAKALSFGLTIKSKGYNVYVSGLPGTGKTTFSEYFAKEIAKKENTPPDLCYIYNFKDPKTPKTLVLPAGTGKALKQDMEELIEKLQDELPKAFGAKDFENKKSDIVKIYQTKRDDIIKDMTEEAKEQNFDVKTTNSGIYFMPVINGEVISEEEYDSLPQTEKENISVQSDAIHKLAQQVMREIKEFEKQTRREVEDLEYSIGLFTVGRQISVLLEKYQDLQNVISFLLEVKEDILENLEDFLEVESEEEEQIQSILPWVSKKTADESFVKYYINLITDNSEQQGAPVIVDYNPTYSNLIGEIEFDNEYGNLTTDFMKIKSGLLHKANGGYLVLQAHDVFSNVHSWETIRRVLLTREIVIEPLREYTTGYAVSSIKPEPMSVDVKVILVGSSFYYEVLYEYDEEFQKLFKICADFDYEMDFNSENMIDLVRFIKKTIEKEQLLDFTWEGVVSVVEYSCRMAESQKKLTTRFNRIVEILIEANAWAKVDKAEIVDKRNVTKAVEERENRFKLYEDKLNQMLLEDFIMIDTHGGKVGQINGLAVIDMEEYAFAKPSRITATTYIGKSGVINIEQEAEMSGAIHVKGMEVISGYLGQTYAQDFPLSVSCRVCFEQNYAGIDGDSASSTELYAILSSLADLPINQEFAVTGSINQRGEIQPIGGVTYKIEGFFDLCQKRGLTGNQGVIIPIQNIKDLMLKDDVVEAVKEGLFHIYPIKTVDEGIEILTGFCAGEKNEKGKYPEDSVHGRVFKKLKTYYKKSMAE